MLLLMIARMFGRGLLVLCISLAVYAQNEPAGYENNSLQGARPGLVAANHSIFYVYALLDEGKYEKAVKEFTALAESNPRWIEAQLGLIRALFQSGNLSAATRAAETAARTNPESAPIHAMLADLYFRNGSFEAAEAHYRVALAMDGSSERAWIGLGKIYSVRSMPDEARRAFETARESNPQLFSEWENALFSSEQLAVYRRYTVGEEQQDPSACQVSLTTGNHDERLPGPHKEEILLTPISDRDGNMRGQGINVRFNDRSGALLMLDTGASGITIGSRLAKKAGVLRLADRRLPGMGSSGATHGYTGRITHLQIGALELRDCTVQVSPEAQILSQDGLIGTDVFRKSLVTIDFPARKLTLSERTEEAAEQNAPPDTAIHAYQFAHILLVPATIGQKASGLFVVDTGANASTVSRSAALKVGGMVSTARFVQGSTGVLNSALGTDSARLKIRNIELTQQRVASVDLSSLSNRLGTEVAGQIGFDFLKNFSIEIDYGTGTLWIQE